MNKGKAKHIYSPGGSLCHPPIPVGGAPGCVAVLRAVLPAGMERSAQGSRAARNQVDTAFDYVGGLATGLEGGSQGKEAEAAIAGDGGL